MEFGQVWQGRGKFLGTGEGNRGNMMGWCRWWDDVLDCKKCAHIARQLKIPYSQVVGIWGLLLALANQSPVRGTLLLSSSKPMTNDDIAQSIRMRKRITTDLLSRFYAIEMVSYRGKMAFITNWDKRQFESDSSTERVRKCRARKRKCNVAGTVSETFPSPIPPSLPNQTQTQKQKQTEVPLEPSAGCPWCKDLKANQGEPQRLIKVWHDRYVQEFQDCPTIKEARDAAIFKALLRGHRFGEIEKRIGFYFTDPDPFITKQGHSLTFFSSKFDAYRTGVPNMTPKPKRDAGVFSR